MIAVLMSLTATLPSYLLIDSSRRPKAQRCLSRWRWKHRYRLCPARLPCYTLPRSEPAESQPLHGQDRHFAVGARFLLEASVHTLEIARLPAFVEPRLQWSVETQKRIPALARHGLHPVAFLSRRSFGAEPHCHRAGGIFLDILLVTVEACKFLIGLQHRAGLPVVDHERPELPCRYRGGKRDLVGLAAVKIAAHRIARGVSIGGAGARLGKGHRRRDAGGVVVKQCTRIEHSLTVVQKLIAAADEAGAPLPIRIEFHSRVARCEHDCARRCVTHSDSVGENALHAFVGCEGLTLFDTNGGEHPDNLWVKGIRGLVLDYSIDFFVKMKIVGVDRIELNAR